MGYQPKRGEGVLAKSQILINNQFGTLLDRRGSFKGSCPKIWSDFLVFFHLSFLRFLLPKPLNLLFLQTEQSTIETAHIKFMIKRGIYSRICVSWIYNTTFWKFQKIIQNVPNAGRGGLVPSEADVSLFWMSKIA